MAVDPTQLRTEIQGDPAGLGYAPFVAAGNDQAVAGLLNQVRPAVAVARGIVPAYEVWEAIVPAEWAALTTAEKQRVQTVLGMGQVSVRGPNTRAALAAAFGPGTQTRANLADLQSRPGSRAEQLFGADAVVTASDVSFALRGQR